MTDDMIVTRKDIIRFLSVPLQLSPDYRTAWRKICRWKKQYGMHSLIHHTPSGAPYIIPGEVKSWLEEREIKKGP